MSPLHQAKVAIVEHTGLAKDALHIYVAIIVFLGCCLLFKWRASHWKPWLAVLAAAVAGEIWDLYDSLVHDAPIEPWANWQDLWNTLLVPTGLMLAARYSSVFRR